jgi:hypothetical protein
MKTIISIPLIIMILFSGISIKFASHYCGGNVSSTKVSLSGELATCGMEHHTGNNPLQDIFVKHCCDDVISSYSISTNYFPSFYFAKDPGQRVIHIINVPSDLLVSQEISLDTSVSKKRPPGTFSPRSVDRQMICIYLI